MVSFIKVYVAKVRCLGLLYKDFSHFHAFVARAGEMGSPRYLGSPRYARCSMPNNVHARVHVYGFIHPDVVFVSVVLLL